MKRDSEWDFVRKETFSPLTGAGIGALRVALLFGSAAVALALIATPVIDRSFRPQLAGSAFVDGLDLTSTGSVAAGGTRYTIRRSVLQASPNAICVIREDGQRDGDC